MILAVKYRAILKPYGFGVDSLNAFSLFPYINPLSCYLSSLLLSSPLIPIQMHYLGLFLFCLQNVAFIGIFLFAVFAVGRRLLILLLYLFFVALPINATI